MKPAALILGILAAFISLPAAMCSGLCAAGILEQQGNGPSANVNTAVTAFFYVGLFSGFVAFVASIVVMVRTRIGMVGLWIALVLTLATCVTLNPLAFCQGMFLLVAAILATLAARDEGRNSMLPPAGLPYLGQPTPYGAPQSPYAAPQAQQWGGPPQPQAQQPQGQQWGGPPQPQAQQWGGAQPQSPQQSSQGGGGWGGPPQQGGSSGGWGGPPQGQG